MTNGYRSGLGPVAYLARPGGNITGFTAISPELSGKRLELLKEALSGLSRVAFLWNSDECGAVLEYKEMEGAARSLGLQLQSVAARDPDESRKAFSAITKERAVLIFPDRIAVVVCEPGA